MPVKNTFYIALKNTLLMALLLSFMAPLQAQLKEGSVYKQGDYEVYFSTLNTSFLSPKIASHYGVVRSKSKALMNIAVRKKTAAVGTEPVVAKITGTSYDLIITKTLDFNEVREQGAVYYLSQFNIEHKIPMYFTLYIEPENSTEKIKLEFKKVLWQDDK